MNIVLKPFRRCRRGGDRRVGSQRRELRSTVLASNPALHCPERRPCIPRREVSMSFAQRAGPALLSRQFAPEVQNRRCATRVKVTSSLAAMAAVVAAVAGPSTPVGSATPVPTRHLERISGGGKVTTSIGPGSASISALVRQPDGKLVAAGLGLVVGSGLNIKSAYFAL